MTRFPLGRAVGIGILVVSVAAPGLVWASSQATSDQVSELVTDIFANVPDIDPKSIVIKDNRNRAYLAFYLSKYADVLEVRAYSITFRNTGEYPEELGNIDTLIAEGRHGQAFDALIGVMRLDLGSMYVSDVGLDGIHEGDVAVGEGSMRDRYHNQQFASHEEANTAYLEWLARALTLLRETT